MHPFNKHLLSHGLKSFVKLSELGIILEIKLLNMHARYLLRFLGYKLKEFYPQRVYSMVIKVNNPLISVCSIQCSKCAKEMPSPRCPSSKHVPHSTSIMVLLYVLPWPL